MKGAASFVFALIAFISALLSAGCGGGNAPGITLPLISVSVTASPNTVEATITSSVAATVAGDPSGKGVTWTVSCSTGKCGSVGSTSSTSPNTYVATYTAPAAPPPSDLVVTIKATSVADGSKSGTTAITVSAITVSVTPTTASLQAIANNTLTINAGVNNDPSGQGVTWSISPGSGGGTLTGQSNFAVTYNAPATPPASDQQITVTATSVTDTTKTAAVTITIPSVVIIVTPTTANVEATGTVPNIVATLINDSTGKGVTWTISCSAQACGSISPGSTPSGTSTTYTAPPNPPSSDLAVTVTASSVADPSAQTSITITVKAISVIVTSPTGNVQFGQTVSNIVATVQFDPANKGVTWAIQPCGQADCGSIAPNATASGAAVTYTAPANPPASNLGINIVASSVSDSNQQGSVTITVLAITVAVTPTSGLIPVGATAALNATPFTVTVGNDTSNQGATWTLTQNGTSCSPTCGTITPASTGACTPNCAPTTYAAPSTVPATNQVTLAATSVEDTTKSATATITITAGTVKLIPASLTFGRLKIISGRPNPTKTLTETLTNSGASALNITGQAVSGGPYSVSTPCQGSTTTSVASAASCSISVTFAPQGIGGFNDNLTITDNDPTSPQLVPVTGSACSGAGCRGGADIRAAIASNPKPAAPAPMGPFSVGTRTLQLVDQSRSDPYLNNGSKRELLVRFWYPAVVSHGCQPAQYTSPAVWNYQAQLARVAPPAVKTNSCQDAAITADKHPVVVFTHGYTGTFTDYTFLFEDLASRGYVVASVNHTFEATVTEFPDGRLMKSVVGSHFGSTMLDAKTTSFAVAVRIGDMKFVVDELQRMNAARSGPFANKLDLSRLALAGHSLGGLTALLGIEMEPRFRVAVDLDGITPGPLFGATSKPVLMLFSGRDPWDRDTCHVWGQLQGLRLGLSFSGSDHLTPSDAVWLANGAVLTGTAGMEKTVEALRNYVAAFLDTTVRGRAPDQLLRGASPEYPDVDVTRRTDSPCGKTTSATEK